MQVDQTELFVISLVPHRLAVEYEHVRATSLTNAPDDAPGNKLRVRLQLPAPPESSGGDVTILCDVDQSTRSCAAH